MKTTEQIVEHIKQQIEITKNDIKYINGRDKISTRTKDKLLSDPRIRMLAYFNILDFINKEEDENN